MVLTRTGRAGGRRPTSRGEGRRCRPAGARDRKGERQRRPSSLSRVPARARTAPARARARRLALLGPACGPSGLSDPGRGAWAQISLRGAGPRTLASKAARRAGAEIGAEGVVAGSDGPARLRAGPVNRSEPVPAEASRLCRLGQISGVVAAPPRHSGRPSALKAQSPAPPGWAGGASLQSTVPPGKPHQTRMNRRRTRSQPGRAGPAVPLSSCLPVPAAPAAGSRATSAAGRGRGEFNSARRPRARFRTGSSPRRTARHGRPPAWWGLMGFWDEPAVSTRPGQPGPSGRFPSRGAGSCQPPPPWRPPGPNCSKPAGTAGGRGS